MRASRGVRKFGYTSTKCRRNPVLFRIEATLADIAAHVALNLNIWWIPRYFTEPVSRAGVRRAVLVSHEEEVHAQADPSESPGVVHATQSHPRIESRARSRSVRKVWGPSSRATVSGAGESERGAG